MALDVDPLFQASIAANAADFFTRPPARNESSALDVFGIGNAASHFDQPWKLAALKVGFSVVLPELGARYLEHRGHRTAAKALRVVAVAFPTYGTYTNVRGKARRGDWQVSLRLSF